MTSYFVFLGIALLAVLLPLVSLLIWYWILVLVLPGFRPVVRSILRMGSYDRWKRDVSLSLTQIWFYVLSGFMVSTAVLLEFAFLIPITFITGPGSGVGQTLVLMSAGPIEETMKLIAAGVLFVFIMFTFRRSTKEPDPVRTGLVAGLFAGACFGIVESIGYLSIGLQNLFAGGLEISFLDSVIWRFLAGVSIHSLYTGIASGGLGRKGGSSKFKVTAVLLLIAIALHSLNNGIQGFIFLVLEMEGTTAYVLTDLFQILLFVSGVFILRFVWTGKWFSYSSRPQEGSKRIYSSSWH